MKNQRSRQPKRTVNWHGSRKQERRQARSHRTVREAVADAVFRKDFARRVRITDCRIRREDVVQETYVRGLAGEAVGAYRPGDGTPLRYLFGIARNVVREHWRALQRESVTDICLDRFEAEREVDVDELVPAAIWIQVYEWFLAQSLPDQKLFLRRVGLAGSSERLQALTRTERSRLHRALVRLRRLLA